jgi:hypothetical protein
MGFWSSAMLFGYSTLLQKPSFFTHLFWRRYCTTKQLSKLALYRAGFQRQKDRQFLSLLWTLPHNQLAAHRLEQTLGHRHI